MLARPIVLLVLGSVVPLVFALPGAAWGGSVDLRSGSAWTVYRSDPGLSPDPGGSSSLGAAEAVPVLWTADLSSVPGAVWVWEAGTANNGQLDADLVERFFTRSVELPAVPSSASLGVAVDDMATVIVNGTVIGTTGSVADSAIAGAASGALVSFDIAGALKAGANIVTVKGQNGPASFAGGCGGSCSYVENPAGVVFGGTISYPEPPTNFGPPVVTGSPRKGETLTCATGDWTGSPTSFSIAWLRNGSAIPGATGVTYVVVDQDQGATIRCQVVAQGAGGNSSPATSAGVGIAPAAPPAPSPGPAPTPVVRPQTVQITQIALLPSPRACVSRRKFRIRLRGVKASKIVRAQIELNGTQVRNVSGRALGLPIDLRGLPKGKFTVEIITTDSAGTKQVGKRTYRTCVPKRS